MKYEMSQILEKIDAALVCTYADRTQEYDSAEAFRKSGFAEDCVIKTIRAKGDKILLELVPWEMPKADTQGEWAKEHERRFGEEPGFF